MSTGANTYFPEWVRCRNVNRNDWVYFVSGAGLIKIGVTASIPNRLSTLRQGSPVPLDLLLAIPGGREIEWHLHQQHRALRARGEWFRAEDSLLAHIERLRKRQPDGARYKIRTPETPSEWLAPWEARMQCC